MNNAGSSHDVSRWSSEKFQEDIASLSEMFPACDVSILRNYLDMFWGDPNYLSAIVNVLLEAHISPGLNQVQSSIQEQNGNSQSQLCLKRKADSDEERLQSKNASGREAISPVKLKRTDINRNESDNFRSDFINKMESKLQETSGSGASEACSSWGSSTVRQESPHKEFKYGLNTNKKTEPSNPNSQLTRGTSPLSTDDSEIAFVKSVASPPKQSFYRTGQPNSEACSRSKHVGICIRYKGGALHPSMNKPKKLQIIEIDDGTNDDISNQSAPNKAHSSNSPSAASECSVASSSASCPAATVISVADYDGFTEMCTNTQSGSKENISGNKNDAIHRNESNHDSLPVVATLDDLEILRKVFPDADPVYISSLLEKYADQHNRVALVGKELGTNPNPQRVKNKIIPSASWFWQSEEDKLIPFTDSECNALEKELSRHDPLHSDVVHIRLPGSTKSYIVNFASMTMTNEMGLRITIVRVTGDTEENKQLSRKNLVPKEALCTPVDWQEQASNVELINVRPGSAEWDHIQRSMKRSLRAVQVTDIQRVQNKWLYRKYAIQRHLIKDKNGPTCINEKELFHGTRHTNPDIIWKGEDGFDMRHSADGMWGRGTYFASEASYCHQGFVYFNPQRQQYQLFLAHVLTGDSISLPPDRNIKMPPPKRGSAIRYDSVNGVTNGCTVYILYKLDMAYPAYLISYTVDN